MRAATPEAAAREAMGETRTALRLETQAHPEWTPGERLAAQGVIETAVLRIAHALLGVEHEP
jgi:hypothetical protein